MSTVMKNYNVKIKIITEVLKVKSKGNLRLNILVKAEYGAIKAEVSS